MARMRTIKPEFWDDDVVATLSLPARLLFIATWNAADDEGLLRWTASYLKSKAFPYDDHVGAGEVEQMMAELVRAELIFPYRGGKATQHLAVVVKFHHHQKVNRPQGSKLTPPPVDSAAVVAMYARRDGWSCHVCHEPISPAATTQEAQPSLDRRRARAVGGSDCPSNIRAAHFGCVCGPVDHSVNGSVNDSRNDHGTITDGIGGGRGKGKGIGGGSAEGAAPPPKRATSLVPDAFEVSLALRSWAKDQGITANLTVETEQWLDYHRAKADRMVDWTASWRTWMRNTVKYGATEAKRKPPTSGGDW